MNHPTHMTRRRLLGATAAAGGLAGAGAFLSMTSNSL